MTNGEATAGKTAENLQNALDKLRSGDELARNELIEYCSDQLRRQASGMLRAYGIVRRWAETDDVLQGALLRLHKSLSQLHPDTVRGFLHLASQHIQWELVDLHRKYSGPQGLGANHASVGGALGGAADSSVVPLDPTDSGPDPQTLAVLAERRGRIHQAIDALPKDEREIVYLRFYQQLTETQVAKILGVSSRTVRRGWRKARLALHETVHDDEVFKLDVS